MNASSCEFLAVVELVEKYGDVYVRRLVDEATDYLLSRGNGFMLAG